MPSSFLVYVVIAGSKLGEGIEKVIEGCKEEEEEEEEEGKGTDDEKNKRKDWKKSKY